MCSDSVAPRRAPVGGAPPSRGVPAYRFRFASGHSARTLAHPLDSSVRVTRRVERDRDRCLGGAGGPRLGKSAIPPARRGRAGGSPRCVDGGAPLVARPLRLAPGAVGDGDRPSESLVSSGLRARSPPRPRRGSHRPSARRTGAARASGRATGGRGSPGPSSRSATTVRRVDLRRSGSVSPQRFQALLNSLSGFFSPFRRRTCSLSVSPRYLALDDIHHPIWAALSSNPTPGRPSAWRDAWIGGRVRGCRPPRQPSFQTASTPARPDGRDVVRLQFAGPAGPEIQRLGSVRFARRY